VRGGKTSPGKYRLIQNYIINSFTGEIVYTPPPPESVPGMTRNFIEWLNSGIDIHPVLISGVAQFQFVHIHPFLDGRREKETDEADVWCFEKSRYCFHIQTLTAICTIWYY
jgi:hypothetical protein